MEYVIVLVLVALAGVAAGFFVATTPLIIMSIICLVLLIVFYIAATSGPAGTSGGLGYLFIFFIPVLCFFVPMVITAVIVRVSVHFSLPDFSNIIHWFLR